MAGETTARALGRLTNEDQAIDGLTPNVQYSSQYNPDNFRTQLAASIGSTDDFKNTYTPDNLQRLTSLVQQGQSGGNTVADKRADFQYNAAGQFSTVSRYANTAGTDLVINSFYAYDDMGRLTQLTHTTATTPPTLGYGSSAKAGSTYSYDADSQIVSRDIRGDGTSSFSYDADGQLTGDGSKSYTYDLNGNRPDYYGTNIGTNNQLLYDNSLGTTYTYDDEGNLISNGTTTYEYDWRNRLISASGWLSGPDPNDAGEGTDWGWGSTSGSTNSSVSLSADVGNYSGQPYAVEGDVLYVNIYAPGGTYVDYWFEDVSAVFGTRYDNSWPGHDSGTVLVGGGGAAGLQINAINDYGQFQLRQSFKIHVMVQGDPGSEIVLEADILDKDLPLYEHGTVSYNYDYQNRLVSRTFDGHGDWGEGAHTQVYSYESGQVALQFDDPSGATTAPTHRNLWNPAAVDELLADENLDTSMLLWAFTDNQGTIHDLATHDSGTGATTVVLHRNYDAFGNVIGATGSLLGAYDANGMYGTAVQAVAAATDEIFGYTGRQFDVATGLQNNLNRWYDPKIGRWISEDPMGFAAGDFNLGRYVGNQPTDRVDPSGLEWRITRLPTEKWAHATATSSSDTVYRLALKIKLNVSEYDKSSSGQQGSGWLRALDKLPLPQSASTSGLQDRCFEVPNTIVEYQQQLRWYRDRMILEEFRNDVLNDETYWYGKGYKVVRVPDEGFMSFVEAWRMDGIYGFVYVGHGRNFHFPEVNLAGGQAAGPWDVHPSYKLRLILMYACGSAQWSVNPMAATGNNTMWGWRSHLSDDGGFHGFTSWVNVINRPWVEEIFGDTDEAFPNGLNEI